MFGGLRSVLRDLFKVFDRVWNISFYEKLMLCEKLNPKACNFAKKRLRHRCFPSEFCEFLKSTYIIEHLRATARRCSIM